MILFISDGDKGDDEGDKRRMKKKCWIHYNVDDDYKEKVDDDSNYKEDFTTKRQADYLCSR